MVEQVRAVHLDSCENATAPLGGKAAVAVAEQVSRDRFQRGDMNRGFIY